MNRTAQAFFSVVHHHKYRHVIVLFLLLFASLSEAEGPRYSRVGDGTIREKMSGIVWQEKITEQSMEWNDANRYCEDLTLADSDDWILPTRDLLLALEKGTKMRKNFPFWSSTIFAAQPHAAWHVPFEDNGNVTTFIKTQKHRVICVLAGSLRDKTPPTRPYDFEITYVSRNTVAMKWGKSEDRNGVWGYAIYRNGKEIGVAFHNLRFEDTQIVGGEHNCYSVSSYDYSYNLSEQTPVICADIPSVDEKFVPDDCGSVAEVTLGREWWFRDASGQYSWFEAMGQRDSKHNPASVNVCGQISAGGHSDWHVPNKYELLNFFQSFRDKQPSDAAFPGDSEDPVYWSSTTSLNDDACVFGVNAKKNYSFCLDRSERKKVICVRRLGPGDTPVTSAALLLETGMNQISDVAPLGYSKPDTKPTEKPEADKSLLP